MIIIAEFFSAVAWSFKSIAEAPLLNASIPEINTKGKIFSKLDGKGYSRFCYISAIATVLAGFLYEINPYIPAVLGVIIMALALIISMNFNDIQEIEVKNVKDSLIDVKDGFKFIFKSPRLKSLLLMAGFLWGTICVFGTYQTTLLKDIQVPAKYIGIILAVLDIVQGISVTKANNFNDRHKNKSFTVLSLQMTIGIIIAGGVVILGLPRIPQLAIIIFTYLIRMVDKGVYKIINRRYMGNFMTPEMLTKVYSANSLVSSFFRMLTGAIGSYILTIMSIQYAMVVIGILFTIATFGFSFYMKNRIGLKPQEYSERDVVKLAH